MQIPATKEAAYGFETKGTDNLAAVPELTEDTILVALKARLENNVRVTRPRAATIRSLAMLIAAARVAFVSAWRNGLLCSRAGRGVGDGIPQPRVNPSCVQNIRHTCGVNPAGARRYRPCLNQRAYCMFWSIPPTTTTTTTNR